MSAEWTVSIWQLVVVFSGRMGYVQVWPKVAVFISFVYPSFGSRREKHNVWLDTSPNTRAEIFYRKSGRTEIRNYGKG